MGDSLAERRRHASTAEALKSANRTARCPACGTTLVLRRSGRPPLCFKCLTKKASPRRLVLPTRHLTGSEDAELRCWLEARLYALSETDSSQWPSPSRAGAIHRTQEGADRWRVSTGWSVRHKLQLFADFHDSAKQRGWTHDSPLSDAMQAFSETPSFPLLLRTARRLVELGGFGALTPSPHRRPAVKGSTDRAAQRRGVREALKASSTCPFCGRAKRGLAAHIAAKHGKARLAPGMLEAALRDVPRPQPAGRPAPSQANGPRAGVPCACPVCGEIQEDLAQHLMVAHGYHRYGCPKCTRTCLTPPQEQIVCRSCRTRFIASTNREADQRL